jgi:hypothetical protein
VAARRRHRKDAGTVAELFTAYVASLRAAGKRSADLVEGFLETAGAAIGSSRPAAEVTPGDIVPHLSSIHDRGAKVHAGKVCAYLSAAFAYGLKAEHDYTRKDAGARWGIASNPIAAIPVADGTPIRATGSAPRPRSGLSGRGSRAMTSIAGWRQRSA